MKKIKFDTAYSKIHFNGNITINIFVGNKIQKVQINPINHLFKSMKIIQDTFKSENDFFIFLMNHQYTPTKFHIKYILKILKILLNYNLISNIIYFKAMKYIYSKEIIISFPSAYSIHIKEPILEAISIEDGYQDDEIVSYENQYDEECYHKLNIDLLELTEENILSITVDQIVNINNINIGNQEVLYIGQTNREPFARLLKHDKVQKLTATYLRNDHETIVIHLFKFKLLNYKSEIATKIDKKDLITTIEAELINYFKPEHNKHFKNSSRVSWKHIQKLRKKQYTSVLIELIMDNEYCKFQTEHINLDNKKSHIINVAF